MVDEISRRGGSWGRLTSGKEKMTGVFEHEGFLRNKVLEGYFAEKVKVKWITGPGGELSVHLD